MKKLLICLATLAIIASVGVMKVEAADIAVTVTMQKISVALDVSTWTIGPIAEGGTDTKAVIATNDGNVTENLDIALTETTCWAVVSITPGTNEFAMTHNAGGSEAYITTSASDLKNTVLKDATVSFNLKFYAPTDDTCSAYAAQGITVTVSAAAA